MSKKLLTKFIDEDFKSIFFIIPFLLIFSYLIINYFNEKKIENIYYETLHFDNQTAEWNKKVTLDGEYNSEKEKEKAILDDEAESLKKIAIFNSYMSNDQRLFLENEINSLNSLNWAALKEMNAVNQNFNQKKYCKNKLLINQYLIKNKLKLQSVTYSTDSALFIINILEFMNSPLFFSLFFILFCLNSFKKFENGRIKFLFSIPISRTKIIANDFLNFFKKIVIVFITLIPLSGISAFLISKKFTWNYPILITFLFQSKIVPAYMYSILLILSFFVLATFIYLFTYMINLISKKTMFSILFSLILCLSMNLWSNISPKPFQVMNPFSYVNVKNILKGESHTEINTVSTTSMDIYNKDSVVEASLNIENADYYTNLSLSRRTKTVDIVIFPLILLLCIIILVLTNNYLINIFSI